MFPSRALRLGAIAAVLMACGIGCSKKTDSLPPFNPRPGSLEFCIVANDIDDDEAIACAKEYFEQAATDPTQQAELKKLAEEGKPPPAPVAGGKWRFTFNGQDTTYRWVELDMRGIEWFHLKEGEFVSQRTGKLSAARENGHIAILKPYESAVEQNAIWSRTCTDRNLTSDQRIAKKVGYFVLIRNAFPGKELTEAHLEGILADLDSKPEMPKIDGLFNETGGARMRELTNDNKPADRYSRALAIIIGEKLISAPTIKGVIGEGFSITGKFTPDEVKALVSRIRAARK